MEIRIPKQKRAIKKKESIVSAAYKLFNEKGYYNTNTAEIAKEAGVSTGIVYSYFKDKKDIFFSVIQIYTNILIEVILNCLDSISDKNNIRDIIINFIEAFIKAHNVSANFHQELTALTYLDEDVKKYFKKQETLIMRLVMSKLNDANMNFNLNKEQIFIVHNIVDNTCHQIIYNKDDGMDKDLLIEEVVNVIMNILR